MKKMTIYELAKELNMSASMISRALNPNGKVKEEKRALILAAAEKYNFSPNRFASRLSMKTISIGIIMRKKSDILAEKMFTGIKRAYDNLKDYKIEYDVTIMPATENDTEEFSDKLGKYRSCDGVIISGFSSDRFVDIINSFADANPNIVQVQAVNENADTLFNSKHDEDTASALAAEFLYNCLKNKGRRNVILFSGDMESALHVRATDAFKKHCAGYGLRVITHIDMLDNDEYLKNILPDVFEKYGNDTDGIYITSGNSCMLCEYLKKVNANVSLVTFDIYGKIKEYMEAGIINATIVQNVSKQMQTAFESLVRYIISGEKPEHMLYTDIALAMKSNMNSF